MACCPQLQDVPAGWHKLGTIPCLLCEKLTSIEVWHIAAFLITAEEMP